MSRSNHPLYATWKTMQQRCGNPNNPKFPRYGARGIYVCAEWAASFEQFVADMGPRPTPDHSVDRIDNDGPYAAWNTRWATRQQQANNQSPRLSILEKGECRNGHPIAGADDVYRFVKRDGRVELRCKECQRDQNRKQWAKRGESWGSPELKEVG